MRFCIPDFLLPTRYSLLTIEEQATERVALFLVQAHAEKFVDELLAAELFVFGEHEELIECDETYGHFLARSRLDVGLHGQGRFSAGGP